jgi:hypothetical protein
MSTIKRYATLLSLVLPLSYAWPSALQAQAQPAQMPEVTDVRLQTYARAFIDVSAIQDDFDPQLAAARNKSTEAQEHLRKERKDAVLKALEAHRLTEQEHNWITFVVSSNEERRVSFEKILESVKTGEPVPDQN